MALASAGAQARGYVEVPVQDAPLIEGYHLLPWDEPGDMAQQTPAPAPAQATPPAAAPPPVAPPAADTPPAAEDPATPIAPGDDVPESTGEEDFSLGDIPVVETLELTAESARKALDTYVLVREKYKDAELENFENLQDFVDQSAQGKAFEADVKAAGFKDVTEWNTTITSLSFAHDNSIDDQTTDIKQQITELQADTDMAQDMRDRMIAALNAMIPSDNNKKVLDALKADPVYSEKLKLLETEAE
jgi:hypothetical protein